MVPFINVVLGTMLPMLGLAKHDNMRWVFSYSELFSLHNYTVLTCAEYDNLRLCYMQQFNVAKKQRAL